MKTTAITRIRLHALALLLFLSLVVVKPAVMIATAAAPFAFAAQLVLVAAVFLGPGLAVRPLVKRWLPASPVAQGVCVVVHSVVLSAFFPWSLYTLGIYTSGSAWILVGALYLSLVLGVATCPWKRAFARLGAGCTALPGSEKAGLLLGSCLLICTSASSLAPFTAWDAIVSWDKWGRDMATRSGLGGYVMGGYPQLVPSLYSLFYKVFPPSSAPSIPDVTHAIHFLNGLFNWLILPGGWLLCRKLKASFLLFTAIFFGNELFASEFASGYVDTATTAVFLCTAGLAAEWIDRGGTSRWPSAFVALLPASAALGFLKGQGFVLVGFVIVFTWAWSRSWKLNRSAPALLALACGTLPTFAFFAHQSATWEAGRVETELLLHTMPMQTGHPELVTRTWPHAMERMGNLLGGYVPAGFHAPPGYTVACIVLLIAAWVLALRKRAVIPVALAATAGWSLWFWNASYDGRNVHQVFALLAACMAAGLHFEAVSTRARRVRASLHGLVVVAMSGHLLAACHPPSLASLTPSWRLTPAERPAAVFGPGCALLSASPLALQAEHIFSQNAFVWLLGDKTVYGWHPFVGSVPPAPGDLATVTRQGGRNTATSTGPYRFETVSGFGTQRLEMVRPDYASVPATVVRDGVSAASRPLPATITLPGVYWIHPEASVSGNDVVLFRVDIDCPGDTRPRTRMLVGREWNTLSSFRNLCYFIRDGDSFKALFWLDRVESGQSIPVLPPLAISKYDDQPITITGVHIRTIKSAAPGETLLP